MWRRRSSVALLLHSLLWGSGLPPVSAKQYFLPHHAHLSERLNTSFRFFYSFKTLDRLWNISICSSIIIYATDSSSYLHQSLCVTQNHQRWRTAHHLIWTINSEIQQFLAMKMLESCRKKLIEHSSGQIEFLIIVRTNFSCLLSVAVVGSGLWFKTWWENNKLAQE